jgi:hypothetical protein
MKIEIAFLTSLLLAGTSLLVRIQAQGVEQALVSLGIEYGLNGLRVGRQLITSMTRLSR